MARIYDLRYCLLHQTRFVMNTAHAKQLFCLRNTGALWLPAVIHPRTALQMRGGSDYREHLTGSGIA